MEQHTWGEIGPQTAGGKDMKQEIEQHKKEAYILQVLQ